MSYTPELLIEHLADSGKKLAELTASMVYDNLSLLQIVFDVMMMDKDPPAQRAAHVFSICCCNYPELFLPYRKKSVKRLAHLQSEGVKRNLLKIMAETLPEFEEKSQLRLMNTCFEFLNGTSSIAVKVYCMEVLYNLSLDFPDIVNELTGSIESQMTEGSAGFKSRGKKILQQINKIYK